MKFLIVRLSSFGDILHGLPTVAALRAKYPNAEIHWVVRKDFEHLLTHHPEISKVWSFDKKLGFGGWIKMIFELKKQNFDFVYDAHNNLRSFFLRFIFGLSFSRPKIITRSKDRWKRFLLFKLRRNLFPKPFRSQESFLKPLAPWGIDGKVPTPPQLFFEDSIYKKLKGFSFEKKPIALVPSAAWPMKRWPLQYWQELIRLMPENHFAILGGPSDDFCQEIADIAPDRCQNFAGQFSLSESCAFLTMTSATVTGDTGLLHASDLLGQPTLALIGPTAFGFPSSPHSKVLEVELNCRPCSKDGRGRCQQEVYQKCLVDIKPEKVAEALRSMI